MSIFCINCLCNYSSRCQINRWKRQLALDIHYNVYKKLFTNVNGFTLSRQMRRDGDAMEYVYGEIDFFSFIALLATTKVNQATIFYDLGSGIGTLAISCAMVFDLQKSCGIELFKGLHDVAIKQKNRLSQLTSYQKKMHRVHFIQADFLQTDFSDATLIFINATALFGESWQVLNQQLSQLAEETSVITTSKPLTSPCFVVTHQTKVQMSWGVVRAFIHLKVPELNRF